MKLLGGGLVLVFALGLVFPIITVGTRTILTCTLCRAERTDRSFLGYRWQRYEENEFSSWHRANRPAHAHEWGRLSCARGFSVFGTTTYFACGRRHPVGGIQPRYLREFVERADTNEINTFLDGIVSTNEKTQRAAVQMAWDRVLENR